MKDKGLLKREDRRVNLLISDDKTTKKIQKSFVFKGHNKDGSLKPLRRFDMEHGEVKEAKDILKKNISVVDLYENSVYLYNSTHNENCVHGYIIKEKKGTNVDRTLIFTKDKVKILKQNINNIVTFSEVEKFIDKMVL